MSLARPHTFRPRAAAKRLWTVELKRSPRQGVAGAAVALASDRAPSASVQRNTIAGAALAQVPPMAMAKDVEIEVGREGDEPHRLARVQRQGGVVDADRVVPVGVLRRHVPRNRGHDVGTGKRLLVHQSAKASGACTTLPRRT